MSVYIKNDLAGYYVDVNPDLTVEGGYNVGITWDDYESGKYVKLSEDQLVFMKANPTAKVREVFDMRMDETPEQPPVIPPLVNVDYARRRKVSDIMRADKDGERFEIATPGGQSVSTWLDKATRTSLVSCVIPAEKAKGKSSTILWCPGEPPMEIEVGLTWLENSLLDLESYAKTLYDVTQRHIADVYAIDNVVDILAYDEKVGYPEIRKYTL